MLTGQLGGLGGSRISGLRAMREEADRVGVPDLLTVSVADKVLHYGIASPANLRELLTR